MVITSGPTYEPIDPVRFIGNRSSGKQGHAIADAMEFGTLEGILGCIAVGLGWTLMPRRVVEQSAHAADLVIESVPPDIALVPTGMIALREGPALPALRTLSEGIVASAQRPRAA